jgi:hypothetical protein
MSGAESADIAGRSPRSARYEAATASLAVIGWDDRREDRRCWEGSARLWRVSIELRADDDA